MGGLFLYTLAFCLKRTGGNLLYQVLKLWLTLSNLITLIVYPQKCSPSPTGKQCYTPDFPPLPLISPSHRSTGSSYTNQSWNSCWTQHSQHFHQCISRWHLPFPAKCYNERSSGSYNAIDVIWYLCKRSVVACGGQRWQMAKMND